MRCVGLFVLISEIPKSRKIRNFGNFELVVEIAIFSWNHNLPDSPALGLSDSRENGLEAKLLVSGKFWFDYGKK